MKVIVCYSTQYKLIDLFGNFMVNSFYWYLLFLFPIEFEKIGKAFSKAKAVVDKEGIPQFYIRSLAELEDFVKEVKQTRALKKVNMYLKDIAFT